MSSGAHLNISNATLNGNSATGGGGGIYNEGTIIQTNVTLSGNTAVIGGGIENHASATLTGGSLNGNSALYGGGGLYNAQNGSGTLNGVTISGNTVSDTFNSPTYGGGIENYAGLSLIDSTVTGNSVSNSQAYGFGGGLYNNEYSPTVSTITGSTISGNTAGNGGGILNVAGLTLTNSTVDGNTGGIGGGLESYEGTTTLTNVTMSANLGTSLGGAIYEYSNSAGQTVTLLNSLIANGASGANCYVGVGPATIVSTGYNLSSDGTCSPYLNLGTDINGGTPGLGPLADNGGSSLTRLPQSFSDAIDKIPMNTNGCGTTIAIDQRGYSRPHNSLCDIGSIEYGATAVGTPTQTPTPSPTATNPSSPTPTPTAGPSVTPTNRPLRQGDLNCDPLVDGRDALRLVRATAGVPETPAGGCPDPYARSPKFGDVNCDGAVDAGDAVSILEHAAGLPITPAQHEGCTPIGSFLS